MQGCRTTESEGVKRTCAHGAGDDSRDAWAGCRCTLAMDKAFAVLVHFTGVVIVVAVVERFHARSDADKAVDFPCGTLGELAAVGVSPYARVGNVRSIVRACRWVSVT